MIPGRALHRLAARICSAKTLEHVVEPAIADLQKEYRSGSAVHSLRRAWILLAGYCAILQVIAICGFRISATNEDERRALVTTLAWSLVMVVAVAVLLILPPLYYRSSAFRGGWYAAMVMPQVVPLAIPLGVAFGVAFGLSVRPTLNVAKIMLLAALSASVLSFAVLAWGVPAAGEAFRAQTFRELRAKGYQGPITGLQKGHSQMTLSELRAYASHFSADGEPRIARQYTFSVYRRFALAAATLALVSVLLAVPVSHRGSRGLAAFGACFAYWMLMFAGELGNRRGYLAVPLGAWLPNLVFIAVALFFASSGVRGSNRRGSWNSAR